jgi:hypothetical protein
MLFATHTTNLMLLVQTSHKLVTLLVEMTMNKRLVIASCEKWGCSLPYHCILTLLAKIALLTSSYLVWEHQDILLYLSS